MYREQTVGVVVPSYNEADNVGTVIETIPEFVDRTYVVDDCSSDGTWQEIKTHADEVNRARNRSQTRASREGGRRVDGGEDELVDGDFSRTVVPIRHERNRGVGGAIKTGYERARDDGIDVAAVMAGDGQMDPAILDRILDPVVKGWADYAKGNRIGGREHVAEMPAWRLFGNALLTSMTRVATGYWRMSDPQNGYTAIDLDVLDEIELSSVHEDYGFCNDLLVRLNAASVPIADVPMRARDGDEQSHIRYSQFVPKLSALLVRDFLWRLRVSYLHSGNPLPVVFVLGLMWLVLDAGRAVASLRPNRDGEHRRGRSVFSRGALLTGLSLAVDYRRNAELVRKADPPSDGETST